MIQEDVIKIIVSTDNHLGYLEKDPIRGDDSFITFDEILQKCHIYQPDFLLLGGDLFHENKPSVSCLFKTTEMLRKYVYNSRSIEFKLLSDQSINFGHSENFNRANFNDPNINVGLPIFTIHGNHDDQIDQSNLCALDLLHSSGLLNLFGKFNTVEEIEISPILIQKGNTKLAIYGLGAMKNERLHRLFTKNKVKFVRPTETPDEWFNLFVIHQNRVKHGPTNYIPETFLPKFIDLVIWGHEHDCRIDPEWNTTNEFYVSQPGSSVATSLSEGESSAKFIGCLEIHRGDFKMTRIALETVRPFVMENVALDEENLNPNSSESSRHVEQFCHIKMKNMLLEALEKITINEKQPKLPLIRLKVDYSGGFEMFSIMRFCHDYVDKVANPKDIILMHRRKEQISREKFNDANVKLKSGDGGEGSNKMGLDQSRVEDMVRQYFSQVDDKMKMVLLKEVNLGEGVRVCVDKDNDRAFVRVVDWQLENAQTLLDKLRPGESEIEKEITKSISNLMVTSNDEEADLRKKLVAELNSVNVKLESTDDMGTVTTTRGRGRGRGGGGGRGRGTGGTRGGAKGNTSKILDNESIASDFSDYGLPAILPKKRTTKRESTKRDILQLFSQEGNNGFDYDDEDLQILEEADEDFDPDDDLFALGSKRKNKPSNGTSSTKRRKK